MTSPRDRGIAVDLAPAMVCGAAMPARQLSSRRIAKPWGRRQLWTGLAPVRADEPPVGEIVFEDMVGPRPALLAKYLCTAERLSIQVHPDDAAAAKLGLPHGKDEMWFILAAEPGATIGLGLRQAATPAELRAAALDGSYRDTGRMASGHGR